MSIITEQFAGIIEAQGQSADIIRARAVFQDFYNNAINNKVEIDELIATGNFDLIPSELKVELLAIRSILVETNTALENHSELLERSF